jgi:plasmid stabilization system protein ParE
MAYKIILSAQARSQIRSSARWYDRQREGLGDEFKVIVREGIKLLQESPFIFAKYRETYRKMPLRRFPYSVIYQVMEAEQTVIVIAVLHQKQDSNLLFEE